MPFLNAAFVLLTLGLGILTLVFKHRRLPRIGGFRELIEPSVSTLAFGRRLAEADRKLRRRIRRLEPLAFLAAMLACNMTGGALVRIASRPDRLHWILIVPALFCLLCVWRMLVVQNDWIRYQRVLRKARERRVLNVAAYRAAPDPPTVRPSL